MKIKSTIINSALTIGLYAQQVTLPPPPALYDNKIKNDETLSLPIKNDIDPILTDIIPPITITETEKTLNHTDSLKFTNASINQVIELLANKGNYSYFHNPQLIGEAFNVSGKLKPDTPENQLQSLAFQYNLKIYIKNNTIYALTSNQQEDLPKKEFTYKLEYLRPSDIASLQQMVNPVLSSTGIITLEPKTNTVVIYDNPNNIESAKILFKKIDIPQDQIVLDVKIFSVNRTKAKEIGVNWASTLGNGGSVATVDGLNRLLGLSTASDITNASPDLVFNANQINVAITALNEYGITKLKNNPIVVTEDNEDAYVSVINRVPIITSTSQTGASTSNTSEEVRYTIDESDSTDPETTREIGTTLFVKPTILPDNSVRLQMRPRTAQIVGFEQSGTPGSSNRFPIVTESSVNTTARIPVGSSLVVGGFIQESDTKSKTKVPLLGDIPGIKNLFRSETTEKEISSLIFVVTPKTYNAGSLSNNKHTDNYIRNEIYHPANNKGSYVTDEIPIQKNTNSVKYNNKYRFKKKR